MRSLGQTLHRMVRKVRLIWRLMWDRRIPFVLKIIPLMSLLYLLSPIDLVPDFFLVIGLVDDIIGVLLAFRLFLFLCPRRIIEEHLYDMDSLSASYRVKKEQPRQETERYIESSYRVVDEEKHASDNSSSAKK